LNRPHPDTKALATWGAPPILFGHDVRKLKNLVDVLQCQCPQIEAAPEAPLEPASAVRAQGETVPPHRDLLQATDLTSQLATPFH
jgi:hypothetical protein